MPSAALDFRVRCGGFVWIFIHFMAKMSFRVLKVRVPFHRCHGWFDPHCVFLHGHFALLWRRRVEPRPSAAQIQQYQQVQQRWQIYQFHEAGPADGGQCHSPSKFR
ncbi:hypothetical protein ACOMHN_011034 [Nucella lapillus]